MPAGTPPTQENEDQPNQDEWGPDTGREEHSGDLFCIVLGGEVSVGAGGLPVGTNHAGDGDDLSNHPCKNQDESGPLEASVSHDVILGRAMGKAITIGAPDWKKL